MVNVFAKILTRGPIQVASAKNVIHLVVVHAKLLNQKNVMFVMMKRLVLLMENVHVLLDSILLRKEFVVHVQL